MSALVLEQNSSSVDVRAVLRPYNIQWLFHLQLSRTEWCDDLDLRQPPRGCSRAEGQNVRKGLCKPPWLQECMCVCVRWKLRISNLCCRSSAHSCHLPVGPSSCGSHFLKMHLAPSNVRRFYQLVCSLTIDYILMIKSSFCNYYIMGQYSTSTNTKIRFLLNIFLCECTEMYGLPF